MGLRRKIGIAGLVALIACPAIALAAGGSKPKAGKWKVIVVSSSGNFKITRDRKHIKHFKLQLTSAECGNNPAGTVTVAGPLPLTKGPNGWTYPKFSSAGFGPQSVKAKFNGATLPGATMYFEFGPATGDAGEFEEASSNSPWICHLSFGSKHA